MYLHVRSLGGGVTSCSARAAQTNIISRHGCLPLPSSANISNMGDGRTQRQFLPIFLCFYFFLKKTLEMKPFVLQPEIIKMRFGHILANSSWRNVVSACFGPSPLFLPTRSSSSFSPSFPQLVFSTCDKLGRRGRASAQLSVRPFGPPKPKSQIRIWTTPTDTQASTRVRLCNSTTDA